MSMQKVLCGENQNLQIYLGNYNIQGIQLLKTLILVFNIRRDN